MPERRRPSPDDLNTNLETEISPEDILTVGPLDIGSQVMADARRRDREDLIGLTWRQGEFVFKVTACKTVDRSRVEPRGRTRFPMPHLGVGGSLTGTQSKRDWPGISRQPRFEYVECSGQTRTVEAFTADGRYLRSKIYDDDTLIESLDRHDNSDSGAPDHIERFVWEPKPSPEIARPAQPEFPS